MPTGLYYKAHQLACPQQRSHESRRSKGAMAAGKELAAKHLGLKDQALDDYVVKEVSELWHIYDVLGVNAVEVEQMSSFYKRMLHDTTLNLQ